MAGLSSSTDCQSFNPRPREGGDLKNGPDGTIMFMFQSTPPRGGRPARVATVHTGAVVSIHAPAWGATGRRLIFPASHWSFNPRPREGGDAFTRRSFASIGLFQSTPPRGGRRESMIPHPAR